jgi:hypothetical protein
MRNLLTKEPKVSKIWGPLYAHSIFVKFDAKEVWFQHHGLVVEQLEKRRPRTS